MRARGRRSQRRQRPSLVALLKGACTTPYEGRYDFYSGWRKAQISQISPVDIGVPATPLRCAKSGQMALPPGTTWAVVRYRLGGHTRFALAPTRLQDKFAVGDLGYANVSDVHGDIGEASSRWLIAENADIQLAACVACTDES